MAGRGDAPKSKGKKTAAGSKKTGSTSRGKKPAATKKDSNRGKRGSSRERDMEYRTDTRSSENAPDKKFGDKKYDKATRNLVTNLIVKNHMAIKSNMGRAKKAATKTTNEFPKGRKNLVKGKLNSFSQANTPGKSLKAGSRKYMTG
jgi:hypothetical protein